MEVIRIYFNENVFKKGELLTGLNCGLQIISEPMKPWYKSLFELITLGWYKAPRYYKCKVIPYEK